MTQNICVTQSQAFVTFLAENKDYVKGMICLVKSLRKSNSIYQLVAAVLPNVPDDHRKMLVAQGCIIREIDPVYLPETHSKNYARDYYIINYSKLRIWKFVEYKKMIYLEDDILVLYNIDNLFDIHDGSLHGVMSCYCENHWSYSPQFKIGYCQVRPDKACWDDELGPKPPLYINAGVFVFEPSISTYHALLNMQPPRQPSRRLRRACNLLQPY